MWAERKNRFCKLVLDVFRRDIILSRKLDWLCGLRSAVTNGILYLVQSAHDVVIPGRGFEFCTGFC